MAKEAAAALRRIVFCAGVVACAFSCREDEPMPATDTGGLIAFRIMEGNPVVATRAAMGNEGDSSLTVKSGRIPMIVGENTIEMGLAVEGNNDQIFGEKSQTLTKGASFSSGDDGKRVEKFNVTAFRDESHGYEPYSKLSNAAVTVNTVGDRKIGRTGIYWPEGSLSFCAYAYSKENAKDLVEGLEFKKTENGLTGSFTYSLPEAGKEDDGKRNDPVNQPDLIFAMTQDKVCEKKASTPQVDLLFHHALSAIVFKVGTIHADRVKLKSIALENFYGSGSCTMRAENRGETDDVIFSWEPAGEQEYGYVLGLGQEGQQANTGDIFGKDIEGGVAECTFMMIPQTLGENSNIVLKIFLGDDEKEYTFSKPLKEITLSDESKLTKLTEFLPDTKYIFTIGLNGDVDITVTDDVVGSEKTNLKIQNTGLANGYIRAAIVGYWADESGNVMEVWNREEEKDNFTGLPGEGWKEGDDGFYYYTKVVPHNGYTSKLFEEYVLSEENKNAHPDQTLILDIVGQIVIEDKRAEAGWQTTFGE